MDITEKKWQICIAQPFQRVLGVLGIIPKYNGGEKWNAATQNPPHRGLAFQPAIASESSVIMYDYGLAWGVLALAAAVAGV